MVKATRASINHSRSISGLLAAFAFTVVLAFPLLAQSIVPASTQTPASASTQAPALAPLTSLTGSTLTPGEAALPPEQLGDLQMVRKHYQAALTAYLLISPKSSQVWNKIGIAYQQMFVTLEAEKSYRNALKLDPKNPDVMNNLGSVYYSLKEYGDAERMYKKALKVNPRSALIYKNLGTDLLAKDKFKKGWECYQTALSMDPEIFERVNQLRIGEPTPVSKRGAMNYYLAKSYARVGMPDLAVNYLRMAIDEGFTDRKRVLADPEFAGLRGSVSFEQLLAEQQMHQR